MLTVNSAKSEGKVPYIRKKAANKHMRIIKATREKSFGEKLFKFCSLFDMFGVKVGLTYKGQHSYSTTPGIITSLLLLILISIFAFYQFYQMVFRMNPTIS